VEYQPPDNRLKHSKEKTMKHTMTLTKNVMKFIASIDSLRNAPPGTDRCGIMWGDPGEGKSTTLAYVANLYDAIYLRANSCWTVTSMLGDFCKELGGEPMHRRASMLEYIREKLEEKPRPILIDEADYLFSQKAMLNAVRDIYDLTKCPTFMIGMEDIARKMEKNKIFARRITQWVKFSGIDLDDTRSVARECAEVEIDDNLLRHLHKVAIGNIGRIIIGLCRIEIMAKICQLDNVTLQAWDNRPLFYDQPVFSRKDKVEN
jgi:DNA transposition AAA+ family ATPase